MKYAYPPEFIEALVDTANRAGLTTYSAKTTRDKIVQVCQFPPSAVYNHMLKELVPRLTWHIIDADGWFYGPDQAY